MKDFDLEAAKRGAAVCTQCGCPVEIIITNGRSRLYPILIYIGRRSRIIPCSKDGHLSPRGSRKLMMRDDYLEKLERGEYVPSVRENRTVENSVVNKNLTTDREYWRRVYAGQAMQGIFAGRNWRSGEMIPDCIGFARNAVELADALIEKLEKTEKK